MRRSAVVLLALSSPVALAVDTYVDRSDRWQAVLKEAYETRKPEFEELAPAVRLLLDWNGHMDIDSRAAALYRQWMRVCRERDSGVPRGTIEHGGDPLTEAEHTALLQALSRAAGTMRERHGRIDVPWGEIHRIRRGGGSWPVAGCRADGISTLRSVRFGSSDENGISWARGGQMCTTVVRLEKGAVRSLSATPFGQSNDPDSPHHADQAEKLFSRGALKPTWYSKSELLKHVESKRVLSVPE